ncbi:hypothetical protein [Corallococcus llansteffanensis]|uniref:hypothetical protein n=1 Tax=Corallococcus llansteffanensis TaxID=2316731 RepID=UPI0013154160|nr:hypothetical protein [Corallococcus llansteffanensis]
MPRRDCFTRARLQARARSPYPVYLLERRDSRGAWSAVPAREFLPEAGGIAVSLLEPGTYRARVASAPDASRPSTSARVDADGADVEVGLALEEAPAPSCDVRVTHEGRPVSGAWVIASGGDRSMPPVQGETDTAGRWPVRADVLPLQVQGFRALGRGGRGSLPSLGRHRGEAEGPWAFVTRRRPSGPHRG